MDITRKNLILFILHVLTDTSFTPDILRKVASGTPDAKPCPIGGEKLELLNNDNPSFNPPEFFQQVSWNLKI